MKLRSVLLAATVLALPAAAFAQPVDGLYVGAGLGYNYLQPLKGNLFLQDAAVAAVPGQAGNTNTKVGSGKLSGDGGFVGVASVGYGLGNGFRVEVEGDYRQDHQRITSGSTPTGLPVAGGTSDTQSYGAYLNGFFDFDIGIPFFYPYVGVGAGYRWTELKNLSIYVPGTATSFTGNNSSKGNFSAQGMVGGAFPFPGLPGLSITAEYRFTGVFESENYGGSLAPGFNGNVGTTPARFRINADQYNHSFLVGLRYAFNTPVPPPPAPPPAAAPVAQPTRTYLVFFDWDKYDITARARQIIGEAAANAQKVQVTRIEVNGHADLTGTPAYNQKLSVRRAEAVAAVLVQDGIPRNEIFTQGFGDTHPLIPTARGVREPQNRRVEIILK